MERRDRRRALGLVLITAALVHSGLTAVNHLPAGWMWLVAPAMAFAEGAVLLAASGARAADPS